MTWKKVTQAYDKLYAYRNEDGSWTLDCKNCDKLTVINEPAALIGGAVCRHCGNTNVNLFREGEK